MPERVNSVKKASVSIQYLDLDVAYCPQSQKVMVKMDGKGESPLFLTGERLAKAVARAKARAISVIKTYYQKLDGLPIEPVAYFQWE